MGLEGERRVEGEGCDCIRFRAKGCVSYMRELALIIWRFVHSILGSDLIYLGRFWLELDTVY